MNRKKTNKNTKNRKPGDWETTDSRVFRLNYLYQGPQTKYSDKNIIRIGGSKGLEKGRGGRVLQRSLELCLLCHLDPRSLWSPVLICQSPWYSPLSPRSLQCTLPLCRSGMTGRKRMMTWTGLVLSGASFENRRGREISKPLGYSLWLGAHG